MCLPRTPKNGAISVDPRYAHAICIPIIAPEFSAPKFVGVECTMHGYIGAQPSPHIKSVKRDIRLLYTDL